MLTILDKINLAQCAAQRAMAQIGTPQFSEAFNSVFLWKGHNLYTSIHRDGTFYNYTLR